MFDPEKSNMKHVICFSSWIWINKWEHVLVCFWTTSTRLSLHTCVEKKKPEDNKASHFLKVVQECIYAQIAHINWQWHTFIYQCLKQSSVTIYHFILIGRYHHVIHYLLKIDSKNSFGYINYDIKMKVVFLYWWNRY